MNQPIENPVYKGFDFNPYNPRVEYRVTLVKTQGTDKSNIGKIYEGYCYHYPVIGSSFVMFFDEDGLNYSIQTSSVLHITADPETRVVTISTQNSLYQITFKN